MKLFIKQKLLAIVPDFTVKDEAGNDRWFVRGKFMSFNREHVISDAAGQAVGRITRELFRVLNRYHLEIQGRHMAEIVREFSFFKPKYHISGSDLRIEGDWLAHDYTVFQAQLPIMRISRQWFTWGDSYMLDIPDAKHELLALGIALAIDCCLTDARAAS